MEVESLLLVTRCEQLSTPSDSSNLEKLISEWIVRFALNAGIALDASAQAHYRTLWLEGFSDLAPNRLQAAFVACLRAHTFKTMPTIADVRQHLTKAQEAAVSLEAEQKWEQVLRYAQSTSPDYPSRAVRFKEQTRAAINAAGGLDWIRDCPLTELQWCKKRFIEAYVRFSELQQDEYLLPPGEVHDLLASVAKTKALQAPEVIRESYEEMRARGLAHSEELKTSGYSEQNKNKLRAMRAIVRKAAPPRKVRSIEEQKRILHERGFL